jgi:uncharacterized membrane protein SpoIIM required for sporulation
MIREFLTARLRAAIILFIIEVVIFFVIVNLPFVANEREAYAEASKEIEARLGRVSSISQITGIFVNNFRIALIELVPGLGAFLFSISIYQTARIVQAIALDQDFPATIFVVIIFLLPHSWIELPVYAVSTMQGIFLLRYLVKPRSRKESGRSRMEAGQLVFTIILVAIALIVAAIFEVIELQLGMAHWRCGRHLDCSLHF